MNDSSESTVEAVARRAREASRVLARLSSDRRNEVLTAAARSIEANRKEILQANERDCIAAERSLSAGEITRSLLARLRLNDWAIDEMALRVRDVASLPDPLGRRLSTTQLDQGLVLHKESCPLGVIGIIFESRPEVIPQVTALCLKSGNAVILKGGIEAAATNQALASVLQDSLRGFSEIPVSAIELLQTRSDASELMALERDVDLIIPRGSKELVEFVKQRSRVPVLGHGEGICHVYVDGAADIRKAIEITLDSKTQYPAACNAAETLLVHETMVRGFLPEAIVRLKNAGVELRGCPRTVALVGTPSVGPAAEEDWAKEYSDLILSIKIVADVEEAIAHIRRFGSGHTEVIVTEDFQTAKRFMDEIDAAGVFHNASTRFADGFRYGLGAELGISTSKLHARGPVGLEGLTTYKYKLYGSGETVAEYASGKKQFKHRKID
jgi:glutamate-5-semialdehyde dehydrogenase